MTVQTVAHTPQPPPQGFILLARLFSTALEMDRAGGEECRLGSFVRKTVRRLPCTLTHTARYESQFGSTPTLEFWKSGYFSRLEEDEKLAVPICSWFLEVRSVRFRDSLNISVCKIRLDHLEWKCGAPGLGLGFFLHFFYMGGRCFGMHGSSVVKLKCSE